MKNKDDQDVFGRCYCHAVRFLIASGAEPLLAGYCHCVTCRQAHAAPIYQYVYVRKQDFQVVEGAQLLKWYTREEARRDSFKRFFCTNCGSKVYNQLQTNRNGKEVNLCGTFPSLFDDQRTATNKIWNPKKHVGCAEAIIDLSKFNDELPRSEK